LKCFDYVEEFDISMANPRGRYSIIVIYIYL